MINHLAYMLNNKLFENSTVSNNIRKLQSVLMEYDTETNLNNKVLLLGKDPQSFTASFLALLEMGFEVHLVHPDTNRTELQRILIIEDISIGIVDSNLPIMDDTQFMRTMLGLGIYMQDSTVFHSELDLRPFTERLRRKDISYYVVHHVGVENPAESSKIAYRDITNIINGLRESQLANTKSWLVGVDIYKFPVLFIFYPILEGKKVDFFDAHASSTNLVVKIKKNPLSQIWIDAKSFMSMWDKYFSSFSSKIVQNLLGYKITKFFIKLWLKTRLDTILGEPEEVIILASSIPLWIEKLLIEINFPITITYGATEFGSIVTYSHPIERIEGTVGKILPDGLQLDKDVLIPYKGQVKFLGRTNNLINPNSHLTLDMLENILSELSIVKEALAVKNGNKIRIFVLPSIDHLVLYRMSLKQFKQFLIHLLNYMKKEYYLDNIVIDNIIIYTQSFSKTPNSTIKRWMYKWK
jgi:acyl-CoA synthetase (AMP-forming)/AMP-acid ligase II